MVAQEPGVLGQREVHARACNRRQRLDGPGQFAFQAALVVQLFLELGQTEFLRLQDLEADDGPLRKALGGELQAGLVHLVGRYEDRAAVGVAVGHVHLGELRDHGAAVPIR